MKLYFFGSCSGTEPFPDRHHTAWALECRGRIFWFDAGEGCAHTAHLMGVDLLAVSDVFISHPHMDHIGGLPHLLWTVRKLWSRTKQLPKFGGITVHSPNEASFGGVMAMLQNAEGQYQNPYETAFVKTKDGVLLETEDVTVTARHNLHLPPTQEGYQSFSFQIRALGKRIVYSGDIVSLGELDSLMEEGCDVLLMESGHHDPETLCRLLQGLPIGQVCFLHHGRQILLHYDATLEKCRSILPNVIFCSDGDILEL